MKRCKICGYDRPESEFPANRGYADGLLPICLDCFNARCKAFGESRRIKKPPIEEVKVEPKRIKRQVLPKIKRGVQTPEERVARRREYQRIYYRNNEKKKAYYREWRARNADKVKEYRERFNRLHREQIRANNLAYYHRKKAEKSLQNQKEVVSL